MKKNGQRVIKNIQRTSLYPLSLLLLAPNYSFGKEAAKNANQNHAVFEKLFYQEKQKSILASTLSRLGISDIQIKEFDQKKNKFVNTIISERERQIALIKNLYLLHSFERPTVRYAILKLGSNFGSMQKSTREVLKYVDSVMNKANAYQHNFSNFDAEFILDNLFHSHLFDQQDIEDFLLLITQATYPKAKQDVFYEGVSNPESQETYKELITNFTKLGFVTDLEPETNFDNTFLFGATRKTVIKRVNFLQKLLERKGLGDVNITILTGDRRLSAQEDGIGSTPEEVRADGMRYLSYLGRKNRIKPMEGDLFVESGSGTSKRTHWNDGGRLNETMMALDVYERITHNEPTFLVDTPKPNGKSRPDTVDTVAYAMENAREIFDGKRNVHTLAVSNQPFTLRQAKAAERIINEIIAEKRIKNLRVHIIPAGSKIEAPADHINVQEIYAEVVAFISESYKMNLQQTGAQRKRKVEDIIQSAVNYRNITFEKKRAQKAMLLSKAKRQKTKDQSKMAKK